MEMNNQNQNQKTQTPDPTPTESKTPEQILAEMREKMVPKEQAEKWENKYNDLFRKIADGTFSGEDTPPTKTEDEKKADFQKNIQELTDTSKHMRPLDMFQKMLDVDEYLTSHGERSCFAPSTGDITADIDASCTKMRDLLESVIAQADGSDEVALAYLGNHLSDPVGMGALRRAR